MTDPTATLTDTERAEWYVDPDKWPHTPPFHVFRALMDDDDNTWWRAGSGHGLNAYEAAVERVEELERILAARAGDTGPCPTCVAAGGPYRCCPHCADDPGAHEEGQRNHHDLPCTTCLAARAEDTGVRNRIEALIYEWDRDPSAWLIRPRDELRAVLASPASPEAR